MAYPTNVVALVESDFLANARELMKDREKAFSLYEWSLKCLHTGEHKDLIEQLLGELINEVLLCKFSFMVDKMISQKK